MIGAFGIIDVGIHFREVLGYEMIPDPDLVALLEFFESSFQREQASGSLRSNEGNS